MMMLVASFASAFSACDNDASLPIVPSGYNLAVGLTPFDTNPANILSSIGETLDELNARGTGTQFIFGAQWTVVCGLGADFDAAYAWPKAALQGALDRKMDILYAMDFTVSGNRAQINYPTDQGQYNCPGIPDGNNFHFTNSAVRDAYVAEVTYIAQTLHPKYFAIGTESEGFLQPASAEERAAFKSAYQAAYAAIKAVNPDTVVFIYFQYENIAVINNYWESVGDFLPLVDVYGFSSYPQALQQSGRFADSSALVPTYYDKIEETIGSAKPILFAELGATVTTTALYNSGASGPQADQELFIRNFFKAISNKNVMLVTYYFYHDLDHTAAGVYNTDQAIFFSGMGLKPDKNGPAKEIGDRGALEAFFSFGK